MKAASIEFRHVSKLYGEVAAVRDVSFAIAARTLVTLLGPSGCGKTTILRMIAGLVHPTEGTVRIAERELWQAGQRDAQALTELGVVFQDANLFPWLSVERNVALPSASELGLRELVFRARYASLREYLDPIAGHLDCYRMENMKRTHWVTLEGDFNWKCIQDNFNESYHLPYVHPQTMPVMNEHYTGCQFDMYKG